MELVRLPAGPSLADYGHYAMLHGEVERLRRAAGDCPGLVGRRVWMVSSTSEGGGVAESLPHLIRLLRDLGVTCGWGVVTPGEPAFFRLTKRLHNMIHGAACDPPGPADRELYDRVSAALADEMAPHLRTGDLLVVHDPQPMGAGALLARRMGLPALWRCHIGVGEQNAATRDAWAFLAPYQAPYARGLFTLERYAPSYFRGRMAVIHPSIDPLSHKNRELWTHKLSGVLMNAALAPSSHAQLSPPFRRPALRLQDDGGFAPATFPDDLELLFRPTVVQVSRWDRLKGFAPLLRAFARLKAAADREPEERHRRRLAVTRLVLAGPDPGGVADDPEAEAVLAELSGLWRALPGEIRRDVALLKLPMASHKENALMVNALQRCASVVVQNLLREGFGLTVAEAMWKARPVLGSAADGILAQLRDGQEGRIARDPEDHEGLADLLSDMLRRSKERDNWGRNGQLRVTREFLAFAETRRWLEELAA
ncbi:MAG: glycosyltransferase, partial [Geminicoccaceae bacterium]